MENIKTLIQENKDCKMEKGVLCAQHCRDCVIWKWTMTTIMTGRVAVRIKAAGCHRAQKPVPPFSGKKLTVTTRVLAKITNSFIGRKEEAGGILGASKSLDIVDSFALIPAEKAGKYYYIPNIEAANRQIHQWAKEEICFCGFIHSHIQIKRNYLRAI